MTSESDHKGADDNQALKNFLQHAGDRHAFIAFYRLCHNLAVGSLGYLQRRGYRLPVGPHNSFSSISDLAIDILGTFLRVEKNRKYGVIFGYFAREGIVEFDGVDPLVLMYKFRALLLGYVRQELYRITQQEYPDAADLKRRLNRILSGDNYSTLSLDGKSDLVCLKNANEITFMSKPLIPSNIMDYVAEEAYLTTRTIEEWCAKIFELLALRDEYLTAIPRHQLLAAAVKISGTHLEIDAIPPSALPTPEQMMIASELEKLREEVSVFVRTAVIDSFVRKGRISAETGVNFLKAAELFLADKCNGGQVDLLPAYFRETMPESEHEKYLNHYKYVFETVINRAEEEFVERIKRKFR